MEDGDIDQHESKNNDGDHRNPSDDVKSGRVDEIAHQIFAVDQQQHENEHDRKPHTVAHLRENQNFFQWGARGIKMTAAPTTIIPVYRL